MPRIRITDLLWDVNALTGFLDAAPSTPWCGRANEAALAHTVQNSTEAAYASSDLFERRRCLMDDWTSAIESR